MSLAMAGVMIVIRRLAKLILQRQDNLRPVNIGADARRDDRCGGQHRESCINQIGMLTRNHELREMWRLSRERNNLVGGQAWVCGSLINANSPPRRRTSSNVMPGVG